MRYLIFTVLAALAAPTAFAQENDTATADEAGDIVIVCRITGMIEPGVAVVVKRAVKEAKELGAKAIIFRVDTPGGRVDSAVEIASTIMEAPCRTIAYIEGMGAISAGALISYSCDDIIMTPGSNIGAATPVIASAQGMLPTGEKEVSFMRAKMRALAESNGHNPDIAQAMVDKDIELRSYVDESGQVVVYAITNVSVEKPKRTQAPASPIEEILRRFTGSTPPQPETVEEELSSPESETPGPGTLVYEDGSEQVLASGKLLTMTPMEAEKYGLIQTIVKSLDEAVAFYELGDVTYHEVEANWAEKTFRFLTNPTVTGLLLMLGMGGLYFEVKTPGFGIPGLIGVTCLALLFGSHFVLGLTDVIDIVLIVSGVILLVVELFILPGFGIAGFAGFACIIIGTYLALVNAPIPQYSWDYDRLNEVTYSFAIALVTFFIFVAVTWCYLPRTSL
ncbi:MAG: hypothetical protein IID09_05040, partial [Candidatus Hydrogenedentes bacterium]|nr:hypothetical protein [Candidatus Hydrogenedentota bacterium]